MTKKEIVRRAICHEDVPEIPYAVSFVEAELEKMVHYTGNIDYMESVGNYLESCVYSPGMRPAEHPGYVRIISALFGIGPERIKISAL